MASTARTYEAFLRQYLKKYGVSSVDVTESATGIDVAIGGSPFISFRNPDKTRSSLAIWLESTTTQIVRKLKGEPPPKPSGLPAADLVDLFETAIRNRPELSDESQAGRDATIAVLREEIVARMDGGQP